jgi:calcineurin-like phosphoesterase family protein
MTIWISSDFHIGHANIIRADYCDRPFTDIDHMTREIIARHNAVVKPDDEVFNLGDFSLSEKWVPIVLPQLNGIHHLVMGNHDKCHPHNKKHQAAIQRYLGYGFVEVVEETRIGPFRAHHMPYSGDSRHEQRYLEYRPIDKGDWLLHGHTHSKVAIDPAFKRQIHVGVDAWNFTPVSLDTLIALKDAHSEP